MVKFKLQPGSSSQKETATLELTTEQWASIEASLAAGNKLEAIKQARQWAGVDLRTAKLAVEAYHHKLHELDPQKYPKSSSSPGCSVSVGVLALMIGGAGLWLGLQ